MVKLLVCLSPAWFVRKSGCQVGRLNFWLDQVNFVLRKIISKYNYVLKNYTHKLNKISQSKSLTILQSISLYIYIYAIKPKPLTFYWSYNMLTHKLLPQFCTSFIFFWINLFYSNFMLLNSSLFLISTPAHTLSLAYVFNSASLPLAQHRCKIFKTSTKSKSPTLLL